jgi:hypothetical protein
MASFVLTDQTHTIIANSIYNEILSGTSVFSYFMGGINGVLPSPSDSTFNYELKTRNNILGTKRINSSDVSYVVPTYNWVTGSIYDQYDDFYSPTYPAHSGATNLTTAMFYTLTTDFNVYKCLNNFRNSPSTVMPTGTSSTRFTTSDGYIWKFMYSIPLSARNKFVSASFMPVQTSLQEQFYSSGAITSVSIISPGSGYTSATIVVAGDGTGALMSPVISNGQITGISMTNSGIGYTYSTLTVVGDGTGADIVANLSVGDLSTFQSNVELLAVKGTIENIVVMDGGTSYSGGALTIFGDGTGATAVPIISGGVVTGVTITNPGSGYSYATVSIPGSNSVLRAIMSPTGGHGSNAVNELCANRLTFYTTITGEKNQGFTIANSFAQIGIVRNIRSFGNPSRFYGTNGSPLYAFTVTGSTVQMNDNLVNATTGAQYKIFAVDATGTNILVQDFNNEIPTINTVLNNTSRSGQNTVTAIITPTVNKFTGDIVYINNVQAVQSSSDQIVTFKTSIQF